MPALGSDLMLTGCWRKVKLGDVAVLLNGGVQESDPYRCQPSPQESQALGGCRRDIQKASANVGAAVVDPQRDGALVEQVGNAYPSA